MGEHTHRVLLANADEGELAALALLVEAAGHEVVALAISPGEAAEAIVEHKPSLAMLLVEPEEIDHALGLMVEIRSFTDIPLAVLAREVDDQTLRKIADHSMEALHLPGEAETVARVIEVAARREADRRRLERRVGDFEGVLERRSTIEQAKGILMERHGIDATGAFESIRDHARARNLRVVDVADSIITARDLLVAEQAVPQPG